MGRVIIRRPSEDLGHRDTQRKGGCVKIKAEIGVDYL